MWIRKLVTISTFVFFTACSKAPEPAPAPTAAQAPAPAVKTRSNPTKSMVSMNDPAVEDYIVKDISDHLEAGSWRWTYDRPELRLQLAETAGQSLEVHFSVADATFKTTGPVTAKFFVNDGIVGTMKITKPGDYVFTKPVPAKMLKSDSMTSVAIEAKPFWTSPNDSRHLTLILTQAGFVGGAHG